MNDSPGLGNARPGPSVEARILAFEAGRTVRRYDRLATEEPLEIRLRAGDAAQTVAITMRTPGADFELAAGFLYNEGLLSGREGLRGISFCIDRELDAEQRYNIVNVDLTAAGLPPLQALDRHFTTSSACGVCGRAQIESLEARGVVPITSDLDIDPATILALPERLRAEQGIFALTGGLHAAALFDRDGALVAVREDVGRHNALDKLIGWALLAGRLPLANSVLFVSGRTSYEIVQKAVAARIPIVCAVSAPSSLAVELAREFGVMLVGFVRRERFNVYAHDERLRPAVPVKR